MFSPERDMRELVIEILKKESMSISGVSRELQSRGIKLHRLELTGYLKALADMGILKSRDIKPAKVFSVSTGHEKNVFLLAGEVCARYAKTDEDRATLTAYTLQRLFKRAVFAMELRRSGVEGSPQGRKATAEERAESKSVLAKLGYKIPNSDVPIIVEEDLDHAYNLVLADMVVEALAARGYVGGTTQTKL